MAIRIGFHIMFSFLEWLSNLSLARSPFLSLYVHSLSQTRIYIPGRPLLLLLEKKRKVTITFEIVSHLYNPLNIPRLYSVQSCTHLITTTATLPFYLIYHRDDSISPRGSVRVKSICILLLLIFWYLDLLLPST